MAITLLSLLAQSQSPSPDTLVQPVSSILDGFEDMVGGFLRQLPQLLLGIVFFVVIVVLSRVAANLVKRAVERTTNRSDSFSNVISRLVRALIIVGGLMIGLIIAIPSVNLAAVLGSLGLGSVALGFAFSDILQNSLAGLLLLFRQPFRVGDQVEVTDFRGTVEAITIRETQLRQFDGQRVLIPNSVVYSSSVRVQTAYDLVRTTIAVGVDYDSDLAKAREVAMVAIRDVEGVVAAPAPEVHFTTLNTSTIDLDVRYWAGSTQANLCAVQDRAVEAITNGLNQAGIGLPADIVELDARLSFAEAVRITQGGTGFGGAQNGQSQAEPLPGLEGSWVRGRTGGTRAYLTPHELDDKYLQLADAATADAEAADEAANQSKRSQPPATPQP